MTGPARLPRRVQALVAFTGLGGLAVTIATAAELDTVTRPRPLLLLAVAAVVLAGDISLLRIRLGRHGNSFTWAEASLIVGVTIGGWAWFLVTLGPVILLRQLVVGRGATKAVFNAGAAVLSGEVARLVYLGVTGDWDGVPERVLGAPAIGLVAAAATYFLLVSLLVAAAVAWAQGLPFQVVWRRGSRLRLVMFAGNSAAGLGAVLVGDASRPTIVALPFFVLVLYLAYNNYLRAQQERDSWRELHATTLSLNRVEPRAVVKAVDHGAQTMFGAELTALLLSDAGELSTLDAPGLLARGSSSRGPVTVRAAAAATEVAEEMRRLGIETAVLAPLASGGRPLGVLLLGYHGPVRLKRGELAVLATFADQISISVQHARMFEEISDQRRRLSGIIGNASDGIVLVDGHGTVRSWNPAMHRMTARDERAALGLPLDAALGAVAGDGAALTGEEIFRRLDGTDHAEIEAVLTGADGRRRDVSLSVSAVRSAAEPDHLVLVARDITAQREVEQAKHDFIATVSHELRTPITPIKGYLKLLQRPDFRPDEARRNAVLTLMLEQASQLERLVEDLLSVSRMQHGEFSVHPEVVDVSRIVSGAVRDLRAAGSRPVEMPVPTGDTYAVCDPARLQQVIANLLSNADKYSPSGPPVHVSVRGSASTVEIAVSDHGTGVPLESREAVFEPFRRLGDTTTRGTRGTGLGLHIARRLVEAMNGRIWVDGEPGQGATFHVEVPAAPRRPAPREPHGERTSQSSAEDATPAVART